MKKPHSFRRQLFAGFLLVSLIPLLICSAMLLQIFRLRLSDNEMTQAEQALDESLQALDLLDEGIASTVLQLYHFEAASNSSNKLIIILEYVLWQVVRGHEQRIIARAHHSSFDLSIERVSISPYFHIMSKASTGLVKVVHQHNRLTIVAVPPFVLWLAV